VETQHLPSLAGPVASHAEEKLRLLCVYMSDGVEGDRRVQTSRALEITNTTFIGIV